jgi:hypothetical protein
MRADHAETCAGVKVLGVRGCPEDAEPVTASVSQMLVSLSLPLFLSHDPLSMCAII